MSDVLLQLQDWYAQHCNGEWEHSHGISIQTLDNPGWLVKIDLAQAEQDTPRSIILSRDRHRSRNDSREIMTAPQ